MVLTVLFFPRDSIATWGCEDPSGSRSQLLMQKAQWFGGKAVSLECASILRNLLVNLSQRINYAFSYIVWVLYMSIRTNSETTFRKDHLNYFYFSPKITGTKSHSSSNILQVYLTHHNFPWNTTFSLKVEAVGSFYNSCEVTEILNAIIGQVTEQ